MTQEKLFTDKRTGAIFSDCRKYRYALWRIWDEEKPRAMFIGLNPSTANEEANDATIKRVIRIAKSWGYGGIYMCNCFAFISTNPKDLVPLEKDQVNDTCIRELSDGLQAIVFAWGNFKVVRDKGRDRELIKMFPKALALKINKNGSPQHPLFVPGNTKPVPFGPCSEAVTNPRKHIPELLADCRYTKK